MEDKLKERAQDLGRVIGQTPEYKALERARERFTSDRPSVEAVNRLSELEAQIAQSLEKGEEPPDDVKVKYEQAFSELQASPIYQGMVAAQANFDRLLARVNEDISKGIESGAQSRIILS